MIQSAPMKAKKCKWCKAPFVPRRPFETWCCIEHGALIAESKREKARAKSEQAERKETREKLKAMDGLPALKKRAQQAFNAFIRERDAGKPCICCGAWPHPGGTDAGHYRSVGSAPHLRFVEANVHAQAKQCNKWGGGRAVDYRIGLIARIGLEAVEALEADQAQRHYTRDQLIEIAGKYRAKARELKKGKS
jgi:hypothetical protein